MFREPRRSRLILRQSYFKENTMNQLRSTTATVVRSIFSRRGLRAAMLAGVAAASIGTAGAASASTAHHVHPNGYAPTEQCLNWSGTIKYFPALTKTSHAVTAVLTGTLSNCNFDGTAQTYSGTVFGDLTGTATKTGGSLSGNVAVTWPADANLEPTISPISVSGSASAFSFYGTPSAGAGTGQQLNGSYDAISSKAISAGTSQNILGSAPFQLEVNDG
jgi:hypothetical protein